MSSAICLNLDQSKILSSGKGLKLWKFSLTHSHTMTPLGNKPFENTVGKGEIARNEQLLSANSFSLEEYKICPLVMG